MNREEFLDRLDDLLDRRCDPASDPVLSVAAAADPELKKLLQAERALSGVLASLAKPPPSDDLTARVLLALQPPLPVQESRWQRFSVVTVAVGAAAALAAAWLMWWGLSLEQPPAVVDQAPPAPAAVAVQPLPEAQPDGAALGDLVAQASTRTLALAAETKASFSDIDVLWPDLPSFRGTLQTVSMDPTAEEQQDREAGPRAWIGDWSKPVDNALDLWLGTSPDGSTS